MEVFLFKKIEFEECERLTKRLKKELYLFKIKYRNSSDFIGDRVHFLHAFDTHINNQKYPSTQDQIWIPDLLFCAPKQIQALSIFVNISILESQVLNYERNKRGLIFIKLFLSCLYLELISKNWLSIYNKYISLSKEFDLQLNQKSEVAKLIMANRNGEYYFPEFGFNVLNGYTNREYLETSLTKFPHLWFVNVFLKNGEDFGYVDFKDLIKDTAINIKEMREFYK
jgi:hypothetical protein